MSQSGYSCLNHRDPDRQWAMRSQKSAVSNRNLLGWMEPWKGSSHSVPKVGHVEQQHRQQNLGMKLLHEIKGKLWQKTTHLQSRWSLLSLQSNRIFFFQLFCSRKLPGILEPLFLISLFSAWIGSPALPVSGVPGKLRPWGAPGITGDVCAQWGVDSSSLL